MPGIRAPEPRYLEHYLDGGAAIDPFAEDEAAKALPVTLEQQQELQYDLINLPEVAWNVRLAY